MTKRRLRVTDDEDMDPDLLALYEQYPDLCDVDLNDTFGQIVYHLYYTIPDKLADKLVSDILGACHDNSTKF